MIKVPSLMIVELGANAVVTGLLLGGLYAVASLGLTIAFGLLQIPNVAQPTFMVLGAYCAYFGNLLGVDPVIASIIFAPVFYLVGMIFYQAYFVCFERRGHCKASPSSLALPWCLRLRSYLPSAST